MRFKAKHVKRAFEKIRKSGFSPNKASKKWDILDPVTGERFPPKAVLRIAKELAQDKSWSGGGGPATNGPLRRLGFDVVFKEGTEDSEIAADIKDIIDSKRDATTKERLIKTRIGQGAFREELLEIWRGKCALTGCTIQEVLRASHIKPWRDSDDAERLDPFNGILLAASIDALFDKHLITFSDEGRLEIADDEMVDAIEKLGIRLGQIVQFSSKSHFYLKEHRKKAIHK